MLKIGLLPLDERPAHTRYPQMVAAIADAEVLLPPAAALGELRRPADPGAVGEWLAAVAPELDGLIVALDLLGYGGLIASRTSDEPAAAILGRLELLRQIRRALPRLPIYGFSLVTPVVNTNDALEEPPYWADHGEELYALSQLLDRRGRGQDVGAELARLEAAVPAAHRRDWLRRRMRNHTVNLGALGLLEDGALDLLLLCADDTGPFGLPSAEKGWLSVWADLLGPQPSALSPQPALLIYPGAAEVGCALVARLLHARAGVTPTVAVRYAPAASAATAAAYEDGPLSLTVERQVAAVGGRLVEAGADLWLGVNGPVARRAEWDPAYAEAERAGRLGALQALVAEARVQMEHGGGLVAIADVAYPNGADPALAELMLAGLDLQGLAAYGAWNTAGNTLGTTLAQSFAALLCATEAGHVAHQRLLTHRLLEDWGYQHLVRREVRGWLRDTTGHHDPRTPAAAEAARARIEAGLNAALARLPGLGERFAIAPGSVRMPWGRTFEVDFELMLKAEG